MASPADLPSTAGLRVMIEHLEEYRSRVMAMIPALEEHQRDDAVGALHEAERTLRSTARAVRRAAQVIDGRR